MGLFVVKKNKSNVFDSIKSNVRVINLDNPSSVSLLGFVQVFFDSDVSWHVFAWRWTLGMAEFDLNIKCLPKCVLSGAKFLLMPH